MRRHPAPFRPTASVWQASAWRALPRRASANAPLVKLTSAQPGSSSQVNIFGISGKSTPTCAPNVAQPYRFTLAVQWRLYAFLVFDEYRGTDHLPGPRWLYAPPGGRLPTGLGQGLYGNLCLRGRRNLVAGNQGDFFARTASPDWWANTPLGLFTFGISVGDAGHRKVFVTLGRWF